MKGNIIKKKKRYWRMLLLVGLLFSIGCSKGEEHTGQAEQETQGWEKIPDQQVEGTEQEEDSQAAASTSVTEGTEQIEDSQTTAGTSIAEGEKQTEDNLSGEGTSSAAQAESSADTQSAETIQPGKPIQWKSAPTLSQTQWVDNRYTDAGILLVEGLFETVEVSGTGYEVVGEAIKDWFLQREDGFVETVDAHEESALEQTVNAPDFRGYSHSLSCSPTRADSGVISLRCLYYLYSGGAHGNYGSEGVTFDSHSGQQLSFWDLAENREAFSQWTLEETLRQVGEEAEGLFADYEDTIRTVWENEPNWYLDAAGITIIFQPYEIGTYARGEVCVTLPYPELASLLRPEYQMGSSAGMAVLPEGVVTEVSLGRESGERKKLRLFTDNLNMGFRQYMLEIGNQTEMVAELDRLCEQYLLQREDGRSFLLFYGDMASDDYVTYVYEITDGQIRQTQEPLSGTAIKEGTVTVERMELGTRIDVLGTYTAYSNYILAEDGTLHQEGEWYSIGSTYETHILTNIRELPVTVNGQKTVLPAGSKIRLTATDGKGLVRYQRIDSVEEGEIAFTREEDGWSVYIDGVQETEYFEDLPYAG
ncbi:MAG: DUF3298 domain-containing protein [Lachnospiraceae bacterium]|nr:DUF3298 domain-containing protein [Lachnospiraceae bacterium]